MPQVKTKAANPSSGVESGGSHGTLVIVVSAQYMHVQYRIDSVAIAGSVQAHTRRERERRVGVNTQQYIEEEAELRHEARTERGACAGRLEHPLCVHPRELAGRWRLIERGVADGPPAARDEVRDAEEDQPEEDESLEAVPAVDLCRSERVRVVSG